MIRASFFLVVATLIFLGISCRKSPVTPPQPTSCNYPHGNRNFAWRIDTVAWWPSEVGGVWAFSDTDAYLMGNISGPTVPGQKHYVALHWNGKVWNDSINGTGGYDNATQKWGDIAIDPRGDVIGDDHLLVSVGYWGIYTIEYAGVAEFDNRTKKWKSYQLQAVGELRSVWTDGKGYFIAVGDNGMVYTKDGYNATWVYSKAPTNFDFLHVTGCSKTEVYAEAELSLTTGQNYQQYWKYDGAEWYRLFDNQDTTGNVVSLPGDYSSMRDIAAYRCPVTDSVRLYLTGWESYLLQSKGQSFDYLVTNMSSLGLPLHNLGRTAYMIDLLTPGDIWIFGTKYNFYQWNGSNFQQIVIPGLPAPDSQYGEQRRIVKTSSGKVFLPSEVSSQVYVVAQGTP